VRLDGGQTHVQRVGHAGETNEELRLAFVTWIEKKSSSASQAPTREIHPS
jgi:hypothetical protein